MFVFSASFERANIDDVQVFRPGVSPGFAREREARSPTGASHPKSQQKRRGTEDRNPKFLGTEDVVFCNKI